LIGVFIFVAGLVLGSFLNVCIWRMPRNESVVTPRSHCTACGKTIAWFDNIPVLSLLILGGKCRYCKERISPVYAIVELLTAFSFLFTYLYFGASVETIVYSLLIASLIIVSFVDLKIQEIPDIISITGIPVGLILCFVFPELMKESSRWQALLNSVLGVLAGGGSIYLMGLLGGAVFKKDAMGGGDVKLMGMLGAFLGWKLIILAFFIAPFFGSFVGIAAKIRNKEDTIPYGPHLSIAAVLMLFFGENILKLLFPY